MTTKECTHCHGPVNHRDVPVHSFGVPERPHIDRYFYCRNGCAGSERARDCGVKPIRVA